MKITKRQLKRIIREEADMLLKEAPGWWRSAHTEPEAKVPARDSVEFEWGSGGLEMEMRIAGKKVLGFSRQKQVEELIAQLEELLNGPMRTSP